MELYKTQSRNVASIGPYWYPVSLADYRLWNGQGITGPDWALAKGVVHVSWRIGDFLTYLFFPFFIPFSCIICLVPKDGRLYFILFFPFEHGIYAALHIVFFFSSFSGLRGEDRQLGIIGWEEALRGAIVYNLLQRLVVLFFFFFFLLSFIACTTTPIITNWHNIHKKSKIEIYIVALHHYCLSPLLYTTLFFRTYQHLGLNLGTCVTTFELCLSHGLWSPAS